MITVSAFQQKKLNIQQANFTILFESLEVNQSRRDAFQQALAEVPALPVKIPNPEETKAFGLLSCWRDQQDLFFQAWAEDYLEEI